jgi:predicted permease
MLTVFEARRADVRERNGEVAAVLFTLREVSGFAVAGVRARWGRSGRTVLQESGSRASRLDALRMDVRFAVRTLWRSPGFTGVAVLVLAIGIGASVAIFSVVDAVMLRPLPLREPDRLVAMWEENVERGWTRAQVAPANYLDWRERLTLFDDMAGYLEYYTGLLVEGPGGSVRVQANEVTGNFFDVLGVRPLLGEALTDAETWSDGQRAVVLSERVWRGVYGADPGVIGRTVALNRVPVVVVGVMPAGFRFPREETDVWLPMLWDRSDRTEVWFRRAHSLRVVGRLERAVSMDVAEAELRALMGTLEREYPETNRAMQAGLGPLRTWLVGDTRGPLLALLGAVSVLLLIACVNVANLLLVRGIGRRHELAVRGALGALPGRLARQLLTETVVLATLAGAAGVVIGLITTRALASRLPASIETVQPIVLDGRALFFALAVTLASALLFGVLPALRGARSECGLVLKQSGRTSSSRASLRAGNVLVAAEVALALMLVTGAALLARSAWQLGRVDPGFNARNVLSFTLSIPTAGYEHRDAVLSFQSTLLERVRVLPGVRSAGATTQMPLTGEGWGSDFAAAGWTDGRHGKEVRHREIHPGFFETLGVPLHRGRALDARDGPGGQPAVLINQALAERFFADREPIGQRIAFDALPDSNSFWRTIVGVVGNVRQYDLRAEARPEFSAPATQDWNRTVHFMVGADSDPMRLVPAIRAIVRDLDANLPIFDVQLLDRVRERAYVKERFVVAMFTGFAAVAFLLALVGVYGVAAQAVRRRTHEIGIRMALGAERRDVLGLVVGAVMRVVTAGVLVGLAAACESTRLIAGLLFGIAPADPITFAAVAITLAIAGLLACMVPARRATRADPVAALRAE